MAGELLLGIVDGAASMCKGINKKRSNHYSSARRWSGMATWATATCTSTWLRRQTTTQCRSAAVFGIKPSCCFSAAQPGGN